MKNSPAALNKTPKFGNDDGYADAILRILFDAVFDEVNGRTNTKGGDVSG